MNRLSLTISEARVVIVGVLVIAWADRILSGSAVSPGFAAVAGLPALLALAALFLPQTPSPEERTRIWFAAFSTAASVFGVVAYSSNATLFSLAVSGILLIAFLVVSSRLSPPEGSEEAKGDGRPGPRTKRKAQAQLIAVIVAIALASVAYRLLVLRGLEQTSLLFIGIPALLAIAASFLDPGRSAIRTALKATLLALLISGILWGEGFICILMAAPIFLSVAVVIGYALDRNGFSSRSNAMALVILAPVTMEGVLPGFSFPREETIVVEKVVQESAAGVRENLALTPRFYSPLPPFLRLGFPRPVETRGEGLEPGAIRVIRFAGGEGRPGDLTLEVVEAGDDRVLFRALGDGSHIAHWMKWRASEVSWRELSPTQTQVRWVLSYRRDLDPAWYFRPWERYAVGLAAEYLIDNVAAGRR